MELTQKPSLHRLHLLKRVSAHRLYVQTGRECSTWRWLLTFGGPSVRACGVLERFGFDFKEENACARKSKKSTRLQRPFGPARRGKTRMSPVGRSGVDADLARQSFRSLPSSCRLHGKVDWWSGGVGMVVRSLPWAQFSLRDEAGDRRKRGESAASL